MKSTESGDRRRIRRWFDQKGWKGIGRSSERRLEKVQRSSELKNEKQIGRSIDPKIRQNEKENAAVPTICRYGSAFSYSWQVKMYENMRNSAITIFQIRDSGKFRTGLPVPAFCFVKLCRCETSLLGSFTITELFWSFTAAGLRPCRAFRWENRSYVRFAPNTQCFSGESEWRRMSPMIPQTITSLSPTVSIMNGMASSAP